MHGVINEWPIYFSELNGSHVSCNQGHLLTATHPKNRLKNTLAEDQTPQNEAYKRGRTYWKWPSRNIFCVLCSCAIFNIFKPTNLAGLRQFLCFTKAVHCSSPWIISLISAFSEGNLSFETIEYGLVCWLYNKLWKKASTWDWLVQQGNSLLFSHCILGVNNMWKCKGYLWDITL